MADGVHARIQLVQPARARSVQALPLGEAERFDLSGGEHRMPREGEVRERDVERESAVCGPIYVAWTAHPWTVARNVRRNSIGM